MAVPAVATLAALFGALLGLYLTGIRERTHVMAPFSGGLLLGISAFGLFPEVAGDIGFGAGVVSFAAGYFVLFAVNRFLYPICNSCSQDHDHDMCAAALHGFAAPLVSATALHSFLDGWSIVAAQTSAAPVIHLSLPIAVALHKIPEGIALGAILRAAVGSRGTAFRWCVLTESLTLAGGVAGLLITPHLRSVWMQYPIALAGGFFLYLGFHAVHGEWKRYGAIPAVMPALTGAAGAAVLQQGARMFFR